MSKISESEIVTALYRAILRRNPDPIGLNTFESLLRTKESPVEGIEQIVKSLCESKEFMRLSHSTMFSTEYHDCVISEIPSKSSSLTRVSANNFSEILNISRRKVDHFSIEDLSGAKSTHRLVDILIFLRNSLRYRGYITGLDRLSIFFGADILEKSLEIAGLCVEHISCSVAPSHEARAVPINAALGFSKKIYVVGDSHVRFPAGRDDATGGRDIPGIATQYEGFSAGFIGVHLGPGLAFNLNSYGTKTKTREKLERLIGNHIPFLSNVAFCFGEIDCRFHVCRNAAQKSISILESARNVASQYVSFLDTLESTPITRIVYLPCVVTSAKQWPDPEFPIYGTHAARADAMREFNRVMTLEARRRNIRTIDLLPKLSDENFVPYEYLMIDPIHLSQNARFALHDIFPDGV